MKRFFSRALCGLCGIVGLATFLIGGGVIPVAYAQTAGAPDVGLQEVGGNIGLSATDPRIIAANIINVALSLIAFVLLGMILYAGYTWMTAGGDNEKVKKAQTTIRNAIIGVAIILSSWAITKFVLQSLTDATRTGGGNSSSSSGPGAGGSFGSVGISGGFYIQGIEPVGSVPLRNVEVRVLFSDTINTADAQAHVHVVKASGEAVAGNVVVSGELATFTPTQACPSPDADRFCFDGDTDFVVRIDSSMKSSTGQGIACGGLGAVCEGRFHTGNRIDTVAPTVFVSQPFDGQSVPQNESFELIGSASDDSGISLLRFFADDRLVGSVTPDASSTPLSFEGRATWSTTGVALGTHRISAEAFDIDSNTVSSSPVTVVVRSNTCFNERQDGDETAIDCGGSCGACTGGACRVATDCADGVCSAAGTCVERPIITSISPNNGKVGTIVTISGSNFGDAGEVTFGGGVRATVPARCTAIGTGWTSTSIIVEVPVGATTGAITVKNGGSGLSDSSDDTTGPMLGSYTVNTASYPGICALTPDRGPIATVTSILGAGLGSSSGLVDVGSATVSSFRSWSEEQISLSIPTIPVGSASVRVRVGTEVSNPIPFSVEGTVTGAAPLIESIDPASGPVGEYMTLHGRNFGDLVGTIQVVGPDGSTGPADTTFPAECDRGSRYWSDTAITFKIPASLRSAGLGGSSATMPGAYQVYVQRRDGSVPSNRFGVTVTTGTPGPGLCDVSPDTGPSGTEVTFTGERFGTTAGTVRFTGTSATTPADSASILEWTDQRVRATVPVGARTGSVLVRAGDRDSNDIPYTVRNCSESASICSTTERCCEGSGICVAQSGGVCPAINTDAHYAWRMSTGVLPIYPEVVTECNPATHLLASPSPWAGRPGGANACVNADLIVRFTTHIDASRVDGTSVVVRQCRDATGDCSTGAIVAPATGFPRREAADTDTDLIRFRPADNGERWSPGSFYQVFLTTGIRSDRGVAMPEQADTCGAGNAYCFRFGTRASGDVCEVGAVLVNPGNYQFEDLDLTTDVHADPLAAGDSCLQLNPDVYPWVWSTRDASGRSDTRISVGALTGPLGMSPDQTVTSHAEVGVDDASRVTAETPVRGSSVSGYSEMTVSLRAFTVEGNGPNCDAACINAAMWARFSTAPDPATIIPANIELRRCADDRCRVMDEPLPLSADAIRLGAVPDLTEADGGAVRRFLFISPSTPLRPGQVYHVLLRSGARGGIVSTRGQALASLNEENGYGWQFRTKTENGGVCTVDHVTVTPEDKTEYAVGARQRFTAVPVSPPDSCSDAGQYLVSEGTYAWSVVTDTGSPDASVARLILRTDASLSTVSDDEAPVRAGMSVSSEQLAEIVAPTDPGTGVSRLTTNIQASYQSHNGKGIYALQCGIRSEAACPAGTGLTAGGCCAPRPVIGSRYPAVIGTGICRNTEIFADFDVPIAEGSVPSAVLVAKHVAGVTCPADSQSLDNAIAGRVDRWYDRVWNQIVAFFQPSSAMATDVWCVGSVAGTTEVISHGTGSRVMYHVNSALEPNTDYRVYVRGVRDFAAVTPTTTAIRSERGVFMQQESVEWTFRTGSSICEAHDLEVDDISAESPYLFTRHPEAHDWRATVQAISPAGGLAPIVPIREYNWTWGPWLSAKPEILPVATPDARTPEASSVSTNQKNGQSYISARFQITHDEINVPTTSGTIIETSKSAVVDLCERPWPSRALGAFTDDADSRSLRELAPMFSAGPFYHFSTLYCMDAGAATITDDLPALQLNPVPLTSVDRAQGILRQYLFTFSDPAFRSDGIGIRVASNPQHLSAAKWYAARGFSGAPQAKLVDGYDAVQDGSTMYISGSDLGEGASTVSSAIYIVSHNPDAKEATKKIFDQLIANFTLNTNLTTHTSNVCVTATDRGDQVYLQDSQAVRCTADWECGAIQTSLTCASDKAKMQRDRLRIGNVQSMSVSLESYRATNGRYPGLESGSFIQGFSTSRWSSWDQGLGSALPRDPVNRFVSCGRCQAADGALGKICSENGDCSGGQTCAALTGTDAERNGFDPATCWNGATQRYMCPALRNNGVTVQTSHIYQYRAVDGGGRYELGVNLEALPAASYRPALVTEVRRCSNTRQACTAASDCRVGTTTGSCDAVGGSWLYGGFCENTVYSSSSSCSASETGSGQVCHLGETRPAACTVNDQTGTKVQVCSDCRAFVDGPATVCTPNVQCGNGRVDSGETCDEGTLNGQPGHCARTCLAYSGLCGDGVLGTGETCDNGSPAGTAGRGLSGVNGAYCDTRSGAASSCDLSRSCALDCRGPAPHCGDSIIDPTEQCDGNTEQTQRAVCTLEVAGAVTTGGACDTNADCVASMGAGAICGGTASSGAGACTPVTIRQCSGGTRNGSVCTLDADCAGGRCVPLTYPTYHVRSCTPPGRTGQCTFNNWSVCRPISSCGNGVVDASTGEECDDGEAGNSGTGRCTPRCKLNACGDGFMRSGAEECDFGGRNGVAPTAIPYGSVGMMCTTACRLAATTGGYCGNGALDPGEACDTDAAGRAVVPPDATCRSLGFDYADTQTGGALDALGVRTGGFDSLSCTNRCAISGCESCSARLTETAGNTVSGVVRDVILQDRALPNVHVVLRYNGSEVANTFTDADGRFHFGGIHNNAACGNYTVAISLQGFKYNYVTRELVHTADPSDGYYPYISQPFSYSNFTDVVGETILSPTAIGGREQVILLAPRPGEGETIVVRQWSSLGSAMTPPRTGPTETSQTGGTYVGQQVDPQLVLPRARGFRHNADGTYAGPCAAGEAGCARTINWDTWRGSLDLNVQPHAGLAIYEGGGGGFGATAESIMYRRDNPVVGGVYRYFLVDFTTNDPIDTAHDGDIDTPQIANKVRILWRDADGVEHYQEITPDRSTSGAAMSTCKKYWYVYNQDAITGRITIVNQFMCNPPDDAATGSFNTSNSVIDDLQTMRTSIHSLLTATGRP